MWPDYGFKPTALLGNNLEAFDPIRYEHCCFITFDPQKSFFLVLGSAQRAVDSAIVRIRTTLCEIATRSRAIAKIYMIEPLKPHAVGREIALVPYNEAAGIEHLQDQRGLSSVVPIMTGTPPTAEERSS